MSHSPTEGEVRRLRRSVNSYRRLVDLALHAPNIQVRTEARDRVLRRIDDGAALTGLTDDLARERLAIDAYFRGKVGTVVYARPLSEEVRETIILRLKTPYKKTLVRRVMALFLPDGGLVGAAE